MFKVIEKAKQKPSEKFELYIGDIVVVDSNKLLVVCDGWGQYYFIKLSDGFIVATDGNGAFKVSSDKEYSIGDTITEYGYKIQGVVRQKDIKITVEY